jgi:hypothetical protein
VVRELGEARRVRTGGDAQRNEVREQRTELADSSGRQAELIAQNIRARPAMCYDAGANQLVIPMNANNALAFIPLN